MIILQIAMIAAAGELSVSMRLESGMALIRGYEALVSWQQEDGAWNGSLQCTAQCLQAMSMSGFKDEYAVFQAPYQRGLDYIKRTLGEEHDFMTKALCLRYLAAEGRDIDISFLPKDLSHIRSLSDKLFAIEAFVLMKQAGAECETVRKKIIVQSSGVLRLAAMAMKGEKADGDLRASLLLDTQDYSSLYWGVRAFLYYDDLCRDNWRNAVVSKLMDDLKPDGGWGSGGESSMQRTIDTSLAIQMIILCL